MGAVYRSLRAARLGERMFARLDSGFALLAALIINRSGGIRNSPNPKVPGQPVNARDFMWQPPPAPPAPPEETIDELVAKMILAKGAKRGAKSRDANARPGPATRGL